MFVALKLFRENNKQKKKSREKRRSVTKQWEIFNLNLAYEITGQLKMEQGMLLQEPTYCSNYAVIRLLQAYPDNVMSRRTKYTLKPWYNRRRQEAYLGEGIISNQKTNQVNCSTDNHHCRSEEWNAFPPLIQPSRQPCLCQVCH